MKTVLITGASGGIGYATAKEFAKNGYNIIYHYCNNINQHQLDELASTTNVLPVKANFDNLDEIKNLATLAIKTFGKIDCLVNNAGIDNHCPIACETIDNIVKVINANLTSTIYLTSLISKNMCEYQSGCIVNVASIWGVHGASNESVYSSAKAGLIGFSKAISRELGLNGIRVNAISPGLINTKMNANLSPNDISEFLENASIKRPGTPEEIASVIFFLCSDSSTYITGQNICVDGGI